MQWEDASCLAVDDSEEIFQIERARQSLAQTPQGQQALAYRLGLRARYAKGLVCVRHLRELSAGR